MDEPSVRLDMDGPVAVVRMARGKANALDTAMCRDLAERLSEAEVTAHCLVGEDGLMHLPVMPPVAPMLAKSVKEIPRGALSYEPKWDGFRSVVFRDGDEVEIGSRNERPMTRYFPELVAAVLANLPERCVIDGEIVIPNAEGDRLDFDALLQRVHPADSRVRLLAEQTPASFVAFDLLALGDADHTEQPFERRRALLAEALAAAAAPIYLTPTTIDHERAVQWFSQFEGAGLDGIVAKPLDGAYQPDKRVMFKIKHERTADCVVAGYRLHKSGPDAIGSLLLGLYDASGTLHHVGVASAFTVERRHALADELAALRTGIEGHPWKEWELALPGGPEDSQRKPGMTSRWNRGKDLSWEPLRVERVCEVAYDHMQGDRFRHAAQFRRWRPDRRPEDCRYDQLEVTAAYELEQIFKR